LGNGTYQLSLPQAATTWTVGASLKGYIDASDTLTSTTADSSLSKNFNLLTQTQFSWKSNQVSYGDNISVWVTSYPSFQSADVSAATVSATGGNVENLRYESTKKAIAFELVPLGSPTSIPLSFTAQPTGGSSKTLSANLTLAQQGDAQQNLHFFERVSRVSGTRGVVNLSGLDQTSEDLSGIEIPPYGISSNVTAIRMERVVESASTGANGLPIYRVDAYSINEQTGATSLVGNLDITEVYLTFSFDPSKWDPLTQEVSYSEDNGLTWQTVSSSDVISVDPVRLTVTVRSSHLSLWTLTAGSEGLRGHSGGSSGGGGCLLRLGSSK
jgi:hypothetical protein